MGEKVPVQVSIDVDGGTGVATVDDATPAAGGVVVSGEGSSGEERGNTSSGPPSSSVEHPARAEGERRNNTYNFILGTFVK